MTTKDEQRSIKAVRLLQQRSSNIARSQDEIARTIRAVKAQLPALGDVDESREDFAESEKARLDATSRVKELTRVPVEAVYREAEAEFPADVDPSRILTTEDWEQTNRRIATHIQVFNDRYALDRWDYAIAGTCGLFAAIIDLLFVKAPLKPTTAWTKEVDGIINRQVQRAFNRILPPDVSAELSRWNTIGGADASNHTRLLGALPRTLNPWNHRLRALSHDPLLGFLFGVLDARRGTCTVAGKRGLKIYPTKQKPIEEPWFRLFGRMFGHLRSDANAPSKAGNRGMGLPAPFMGLLRMFDRLPAGEVDLGAQVDLMYAKGYDFRHFVATSIPALIMEAMMRAFYAVKQNALGASTFGECVTDTLPGTMNPRFRTMLFMGYGTMAAVNGGKVVVSKSVLDLNYAAWMGFMWNGLQAMKWALLDRSLRLWEDVERQEIEELERVVGQIHGLEDSARRLPVAG